MSAAIIKWIGTIANLESIAVNSDKIEEDMEGDDEGDAGEEDDSGNQMNKKLRLSKRQHNYMVDDEGMPPFQLSARLARLTDSSPVKIFDSASGLTSVIFDGNPEPKYVAVAPTAITPTLSVEGQKPLFGATRGDIAFIAPLLSIILLWLIISLKRTRKQRRAGRMDCELAGPYPKPGVELKGDLESGSV